MRKVLESEFRKQRKWFFDGDKLEDEHVLKPFVQTNCWPPCSVIQSFGNKWDELPLLPCFEIQNALDPLELLEVTHPLEKNWKAGRDKGIPGLSAHTKFWRRHYTPNESKRVLPNG